MTEGQAAGIVLLNHSRTGITPTGALVFSEPDPRHRVPSQLLQGSPHGDQSSALAVGGDA